MPLFNLSGLPQRPEAFGALPSGVRAVALRRDRRRTARTGRVSASADDRRSTPSIASCSASPIRSTIGSCAAKSRHGWLYRGPDGRPLGYGYAGEAGRLGPVAVRDAALLAPILGHLTSRASSRAARSRLWVGGAADRGPCRPARCRLPARPVPGPALLGPPVRRLLALPADLARAALSHGCRRRTQSRCADAPVVTFAGRGPGGSLDADVAPHAVPADGVLDRAARGGRTAASLDRGAAP